jgi:ABC-type transport system involved in Fe-S cluster assembly fused permease/ATPase subunit
VEEGAHASLMDRKGLYHYLYTLRLEEMMSAE